MTTVKQLIEEHREKVQKAGQEKDFKRFTILLKEFGMDIKALPDPTDEITAALEHCVRNQLYLDSFDWIRAAGIHLSTKYLDSLHSLLEVQDRNIWHEGIVEILYDLKDERSIPSLIKALDYDNSHYDPSRELANKVLDTLYHIGTTEAQAVLQKSLKSPIPQIRHRAHVLLEINVTRRKKRNKTGDQ